MPQDHGRDYWDAEMVRIRLDVALGRRPLTVRSAFTQHASERMDERRIDYLTLYHGLTSKEARIVAGTGEEETAPLDPDGVPLFRECIRKIATVDRQGNPLIIVVRLRNGHFDALITQYYPDAETPVPVRQHERK